MEEIKKWSRFFLGGDESCFFVDVPVRTVVFQLIKIDKIFKLKNPLKIYFQHDLFGDFLNLNKSKFYSKIITNYYNYGIHSTFSAVRVLGVFRYIWHALKTMLVINTARSTKKRNYINYFSISEKKYSNKISNV